jgi:hypothetical protein
MEQFAGQAAKVGISTAKAAAKIDTLSKRDLPDGSDAGLYLPIKVKP